MKIIYKNFIKAWKILFNWKYLGLALLVEFLFFIAVITSWLFVSNRLIQNYDTLQEMSGSINPDSIIGEESLQILSRQLGVIQTVLKDIYLTLFLFVLLVFISFVIFKGISWLIVRCIAHKEKLKLKLNYFLKFSGLTLFWTLILILLFIVIIFNISTDSAEKRGMEIFSISYLLIMFYFAVLSYAYLLKDEKLWRSLKNAFLNGIKRIYIFVPLFLVILIVFFLVSNLLTIFARIPYISFIFIIIFFVLCIWARVYLLLTVKEL